LITTAVFFSGFFSSSAGVFAACSTRLALCHGEFGAAQPADDGVETRGILLVVDVDWAVAVAFIGA
jgi:hypothetical protein